MNHRSLWATFFVVAETFVLSAMVAGEQADFSPPPREQQLPYAMHSRMSELPHVTIGLTEADIVGRDHRALQAAVDYVAGLGGGVVEIGPGEFLMHDSLHLRSHVTVRGTKGKTILRKADGVVSTLALDGDYGEQQVTVTNPQGFSIGSSVAVWDDHAGGFHTTVARVTGRNGNTLALNKPLMADCMVASGAKAATVFPVVSGYDLRGARIEDLIIDGNREGNVPLNGCRGAGIFLYRGFGTVIQRCSVRQYNGDGISFQQSNDVQLIECICEDNAQLGFHPGSGSQRPTIRGCVARRNGTDGLFLCWRVRHGLFEENVLEGNGRYGISIGHKDSDNLLQRNVVRANAAEGVYFRNESMGMAPHRNRLKENVIENNGMKEGAAGIRVRGETSGLVFEGNIIRDTREGANRTQRVGVIIEPSVGDVQLENNQINADTAVDDRRE